MDLHVFLPIGVTLTSIVCILPVTMITSTLTDDESRYVLNSYSLTCIGASNL